MSVPSVIRLMAATVAVLFLGTPTLLAADTDRDGVADSIDNCPNYWNPRLNVPFPYNIQPDADEDGLGNACDECTDQDGDGYGDPGFPTNTCLEDNCPGFANPDQADSDGDGIGDPCEGLECGDVDGSGGVDIGDLILMVEFLWAGRRSPVSTDVANTDGCDGVNAHDLTYTWSYFGPIMLNCEGTPDCPPLPGGAIVLDHVHGLLGSDSIPTGNNATFYLRMVTTSAFTGLTNGFRIYSPTGANWTTTVADATLDFGSLSGLWGGFDLVRSIRRFGVTGSGADTVGLGYIAQSKDGMYSGFDSVTHTITIGPIDASSSPGEICLDSCWYPPGGSWMWGVYWETPPHVPSWDGPHCFTIYNCCRIRGDIDSDGSDPDIADLIYMVTYMFQEGPRPPCMTAVDINGDGLPEPDIADLIYLVTFMFQDGPPPVACPE